MKKSNLGFTGALDHLFRRIEKKTPLLYGIIMNLEPYQPSSLQIGNLFSFLELDYTYHEITFKLFPKST